MKILNSIINWELWQKLKAQKAGIKTEYAFTEGKVKDVKTINICLGVGMNQIFPEYTTIIISNSILDTPIEADSIELGEHLTKPGFIKKRLAIRNKNNSEHSE